MIEFLKTGNLQPPKAITAPPGANPGDVAYITPSFEEGLLLFKNNQSGDYYQLAWLPSGQEKAVDRRRPLPPGDYWLAGYRLVRRDEKGRTWFISATARLQPLTLKAGQEEKVAIDETIHILFKAQPNSDSLKVNAMVMGGKCKGVSIYCDGQRIPLDYKVTSALGKELARGTLEYG